MNATETTPSHDELREIVRLKHPTGDPSGFGWATRMRLDFGYFTPDEIYEHTVSGLVHAGTSWLDVGCGRNLFPSNPRLARELAGRCLNLVGVDPDATIDENEYVRERVRGTLADVPGEARFDLITLRMVAEHVEDPPALADHLARLTRPGGRVVIITVDRWAPVTLIARFTPFWLHHPIKRLAWGTEDKDTFPVVYRMNTRSRLRRLFEGRGFRESRFAHLDDCRTFANTRPLLFLELSARAALRRIGLRYPESCLLGVYERS